MDVTDSLIAAVMPAYLRFATALGSFALPDNAAAFWLLCAVNSRVFGQSQGKPPRTDGADQVLDV